MNESSREQNYSKHENNKVKKAVCFDQKQEKKESSNTTNNKSTANKMSTDSMPSSVYDEDEEEYYYADSSSEEHESVGYTSDESSEHSTHHDHHPQSSAHQQPSQLTQLCQLVRDTNSPYHHRHYIQALTADSDDLNLIRSSRVAFHQNHPLSLSDWKRWIHDEINLSMDDNDFTNVTGLLQDAITHLPCTELVDVYYSFLTDRCKHSSALTNINEEMFILFRLCIEHGIVAHFNNGLNIWNSLNKFITANADCQSQGELKISKPPYLTDVDTVDTEKSELASSLKVFEDRIDTEVSKANLEKLTTQPVHSIDEHNQQQEHIYAKSNEIVPLYLSYISYCADNKLHLCATSLFERCIQRFPLNPTIWQSYLEHAQKHRCGDESAVKFIPTYESILRRAVLHCPTQLHFWVLCYNRISSLDTLKDTVKKSTPFISTSHDLSNAHTITCLIWSKYYALTVQHNSSPNSNEVELNVEEQQTKVGSNEDGKGKEVHKTFNEILNTLHQLNIQSSAQWASASMFASSLIKDEELRVKIRESVVSLKGNEGRWWLLCIQNVTSEYLSLFRSDPSNGHMDANKAEFISKVRSLYERGINVVDNVNDIESLEDSWLQFEAKYSPLEELNHWIVKIHDLKERRTDELNEHVPSKAPSYSDDKLSHHRNVSYNNQTYNANGIGDDNSNHVMKTGYVNEKNRKNSRRNGRKNEKRGRNEASNSASRGPAKKRQRRNNDNDGGGGRLKKENGTMKDIKNTDTMKDDGDKIEKEVKDMKIIEEPKTEPRTIYVNNLPYSTKEDDLVKTFEFAGTVKQVRLPKRSDGATKGFAYIEFNEDDAVEKALTIHRSTILGREVWIRRSQKRPTRPSKKNNHKGEQSHVGGVTKASGRKARVHVQRPSPSVSNAVDTADDKAEDVAMKEKGNESDQDKSQQLQQQIAPKSQEDFRKMLFGDTK